MTGRPRVIENTVADRAEHGRAEADLTTRERLRLLWATTGIPQKTFADECKVGQTTMENALGWKARDISDDTVDAILAWFCKERRYITLEEFMAPCDGKDAVEKFVAWVDGPADFTAPLGSAEVLKEIEPGPEWDNAWEGEIAPFLDREDPNLVRVIQASGMPESLRLFAHYIFRRARMEGEKRRFCFLSVNRQRDGHKQHRVTFSTLVAQLDAFCSGRPEEMFVVGDPKAPVRLSTSRDIKEAIGRIREAMARDPFILVLDASTLEADAYPSLHSLVVDDGMDNLLHQLMNPRLTFGKAARDPSLFYRNRIIILTESGLRSAGGFETQSFELPKPSHPALGNLEELRNTLAYLRDPSMGDDYAAALASEADTTESDAAKICLEQVSVLEALILRFAALSEDGLRIGTMQMLLRMWHACSDERTPPDWRLEAAPSYIEVTGAVKGLSARRLVAWGHDEAVHGMGNFIYPAAYQDAGSENHKDLHKGLLLVVNIASLALRRGLIADMTRPDSDDIQPMLVRRMHFLIGEAALRQHTMIARHADWDDSFDARYYRRLGQALYHGFASMPAKDEPAETTLDRVMHAVPATPVRRYERLYAVYYRGLMESPPSWEVSRVLGRDDLKVDIVTAAITAGRPLNVFHTARYGGPTSRDLPDSPFAATPDDNNRYSMLDQFNVLSRAAFHRNDISLAQRALGAGAKVLETIDDKTDRRYRLAKQRMAKVEIDVVQATASKHNFRHKAQIDALLDKNLLKLLTKIPSLLDSCPSVPGRKPWPVEKLLTDLADEYVDAIKPAPLADDLAYWSDILCRKAEAEALWQHLRNNKPANLGSRVRRFLEAICILVLAERFRRRAFETDPLRRDFFINGHATRVFIRTLLVLIKAYDNLQREQVKQLKEPKEQAAEMPSLPSRIYLAEQARRHMDVLSRYMARYPTERVSLLILESTYARVVGRANPRADDEPGRPFLPDLKVASRVMDEADSMIGVVVQRPRVLMRFYLERCKVLRELGEAMPASDARNYTLAAARYDVDRLEILADRYQAEYWIEYAEDQAKRIPAI